MTAVDDIETPNDESIDEVPFGVTLIESGCTLGNCFVFFSGFNTKNIPTIIRIMTIMIKIVANTFEPVV